MVHVKKLRGKMAEKGRSGKDMAAVINKTPKTFYDKMKKGVFDSDEIAAIVEDLEIENPMEIFFCRGSNLTSYEKGGKQNGCAGRAGKD